MLNDRTINGYKLIAQLPSGGMAEVWEAETMLGDKVAVKILHKKFCDDEQVIARFNQEAEISKNLKHDFIRSIRDIASIDERPCLIMEYLDGENLAQKLKADQRFTDEELITWWNTLVDALNYSHHRGVIHRDIKPSNIFITREGQLFLTDFGIAKVKEDVGATLTGQALGTMMYMSPEQIIDSKRVNHKTDVYSLAVTFFHLVTGIEPYDRANSSDFVIQSHIVNDPLNMKLLPAFWRDVLSPCLEKLPEKRCNLLVIGAEEEHGHHHANFGFSSHLNGHSITEIEEAVDIDDDFYEEAERKGIRRSSITFNVIINLITAAAMLFFGLAAFTLLTSNTYAITGAGNFSNRMHNFVVTPLFVFCTFLAAGLLIRLINNYSLFRKRDRSESSALVVAGQEQKYRPYITGSAERRNLTALVLLGLFIITQFAAILTVFVVKDADLRSTQFAYVPPITLAIHFIFFAAILAGKSRWSVKYCWINYILAAINAAVIYLTLTGMMEHVKLHT